jgi:hypothetical protein
MGLFGKILSGLEVIGGAVMMFIPGMQLAGAMLITSGLASSGLIGGSVGKFLNSGWGQGLMAAVSLGSTAYAMFGSSVLQSAETSAAMTAQAEQGATEAAVGASNAASAQVTADLAAGTGGSDLVQTGASISGAAGVNTASFVSAESAAAGGSTAQALGQATSVVDPLNPEANLAMTQSNEAATNAVGANANAAVNPGAGAPASTPDGGSMGLGRGNPGAQVYSGAEGNAPTGASAPDAAGPGAPAPTPASAVAPGASDAASSTGAPAGAAAPPSNGGFLSTAAKFADTKGGAAAIQGVGSMLGGIGQGMAQKSAMEDQIRAQQWAGRTYMDPQAQAQLQGAAAAPITVPSGYLQRAQALRAMLNNSAVTGPGAPPAPVAYKG